MRKWLILLMTLLTIAVQAQRQQISYIEETRNWYYVYDEAGKKIGGLSSRKGSWIFTWNKDGKKLSARSVN